MTDLPVFKPQENVNDLFVHIRVQKIANGYVIRGSQTATYCGDIESAGELVKDALLKTDWDTRTRSTQSKG